MVDINISQLLSGSIDFQNPSRAILGNVNLGDTTEFNLELLKNGEKFIVPETASVELHFLKADKTVVRQLEGIKVTDNILTGLFDEQAVTCKGTTVAQIKVIDKGRITSTACYFNVLNTIESDVVESVTSIKTLEEMDAYIKEAVAVLEGNKALMDEVSADLKSIKPAVADVVEKVSGATTIQAELSESITKGNKAKEELKAVTEEGNSLKTALEKATTKGEAVVDSVAGIIAEAERKGEALDSKSASVRKEIETLASDKIAEVKTVTQKAESVKQSLEVEVANAQAVKNSIKSTINEAESIDSTLRHTVNNSGNKKDEIVSELNSTVSNAENKVEELTEITAENVRTLEGVNQEAVENISTLENRTSTARTVIADLEAKTETAESVINTLDHVAELPEVVEVKNQVKNATTDVYGKKHGTLDERLWADFSEIKKDINDASYLQYTGQSIKAENTHIAVMRDLNIKGKTYQNLIQEDDNSEKYAPYEITEEHGEVIGSRTLTDTNEGETVVNMKGVTYQNIVKSYEVTNFSLLNATIEQGYFKIKHAENVNSSFVKVKVGTHLYKPNTKYTVIVDIKENTCDKNLGMSAIMSCVYNLNPKNFINKTGISMSVITTRADISVDDKGNKPILDLYFGIWEEGGDLSNHITFRYWILEGDYSSTPIEQLPYVEGIQGVGDLQEDSTYKVEVESTGKNLVNPLIPYPFTIVNGDYLSNDGSLLSVVKVKPNTTYTMSVDRTDEKGRIIAKFSNRLIRASELSGGVYTQSSVYNFLRDNYANGRKFEYTIKDGSKITFTTLDDCNFIYINVDSAYGSNIFNGAVVTTINSVQLEEGSTATSYAPYVESKSSIILPEQLHSLPNGVADEIVGNKLIRRVGKVVLDGSFNIFPSSTAIEGKNRWAVWRDASVKNVPTRQITVVCDRFPAVSGGATWDGAEGICQNSSGTVIYLAIAKYFDGSVESKLALDQELKANPVTVYYELAEPIIEDLPSPLTLSTYNPITHINCNSIVSPVLTTSKGVGYKALLKPNTVYTAKWTGNNQGDSNIKLQLGDSGTPVVVSRASGSATVRTSQLQSDADSKLYVTGNGTKIKNLMLLEGTDVDNAPYIQGIESVGEGKDVLTVRSTGRNLWNCGLDEYTQTSAKDTSAVYTVTKDSITWKKYSDNYSPSFSYHLQTIPNEQYTISFGQISKGVEVIISDGHIGTVYNPKKVIISTSNGSFLTFTARSNKTTFRFANVGGTGKLILSNPVLTVGETPTPYEPYTESVITYPLTEPLRSLPNGVADEITDDGRLIRRVGKVDLVDIDEWGKGSVGEKTIMFAWHGKYDAIYKCKTSSHGYCDTVVFHKDNSDDKVHCRINGASPYGSVVFWINKSQLSAESSQGFKQWLSQNPTTVYYELATPVITQLPVQTLKSHEGITHISGVETTVLPVITGSILSDVTAVISKLRTENNQLLTENSSLRASVETLEQKAVEVDSLSRKHSKLDSTTSMLKDNLQNVEDTQEVVVGNVSKIEAENVELLSSNFELDFRVWELEWLMEDILNTVPSTVSTSLNINRKGEIKSMARTVYEQAKKLILLGEYDKADMEYKLNKYLTRNVITRAEYDELISLMEADELTGQ